MVKRRRGVRDPQGWPHREDAAEGARSPGEAFRRRLAPASVPREGRLQLLHEGGARGRHRAAWPVAGFPAAGP
eukprot:8095818-Pyramimonas_sp.AAC.1